MKNTLFKKHPLAAAVSVISAMLISGFSYAQENQNEIEKVSPSVYRPDIEIEEVVITARLKDSTTAIIQERLEQAYSAEILGVEQITKAGDSNIASALRRVTGLTLVDGKFVYVRGLGERYSSTTLNGASVPSPELTRNVIPLDLYPTSILQSVKVQKAYSAEQPAAFGGGNIDIRTRGVPEQGLFNISFGSGWNSNSGDKGLKLQGDGGGLPSAIGQGIQDYQGNVSISGILPSINNDGGPSSAAERAQADLINRQLLLTLNRNVDLSEESLDPDFSGSISAGNSWNLTDDLMFGVLANYDVKIQVRNENQIERVFTSPNENFSNIQRTVEEENSTKALNFGLNYQDKHFIKTNSFLLNTDEDQSRISSGFDSNFVATDGRQKLSYDTRLEQRELKVNQIIGEHFIDNGEFGFIPIPAPFESLDIRWIYSDSTAMTNVPNAINIEAQNVIDPTTFEFQSTRLRGNSSSMAEFSFLELEDQVESYGMHFEAPFETNNFFGSLSAGWLDTNKAREYYGYTANIESGSLPINVLTGTPSQVLTDANLANPNNSFGLSLGSNFGTESYVAAQVINALYGAVDVTWQETWRLSAGLRWEQFEQATLPIDLLDYSGVTIQRLIDELQQPGQTYAISNDDYYPAIALTYLGDGLFGADTYQLRFGYGKTVVRPDLREVSDVEYIDPTLNIRVAGNRNLVSSDIDQIDLRAELFYPDGSNLTASLFYKDIEAPIETIGSFASDDNKRLTFVNAESGQVYGIEFELFKELGAGFFLNGNLTLSDSETTLNQASQTNQTRRLTGHSEYVGNAQIGFDSDDGLHSASLVYNYFSERLYFGGLSPDPDAFEKPIHSFDLVYSFYPTYNLSFRAKIKNLLNEDVVIEQGGIDIIEQEKGTSFSLDMKYDF